KRAAWRELQNAWHGREEKQPALFPIGDIPLVSPDEKRPAGVQEILDTLRRLQHVPADRIGPAEVYPLDDADACSTPGPRAERTIAALHWFGDQETDALQCHPNESRRTLLHQVQAWM